MLRLLLFPLLLLLAWAPAHAEAPAPLPEPEGSGQQISGQTLIDWDYGYTLHLPSPDWHLLPEERARGLYPDAQAGAAAKGGHVAAVIIEEAAGDLASMHRMLLSGLGDLVLEVLLEEELTWAGQPAIQSHVVVSANGIQVRQLRVVFLWDGHAVQLLCNGPIDPAKNRCQEFAEGFTLQGTAIRGRVMATTPDVATRAWRIQDGVFESAVNGFSLAPPPGWRLMVGDELKLVSPDAEVGLARARPDAYAYLLPERAGAGSLETMAARYRSMVLEGSPGSAPNGELSAQVLGEPLSLLRLEPRESELYTSWHGTWNADTRYWQLMAWTSKANADAMSPEIASLLSGFALLDEPRRAALEQELSTTPVPVEIGDGWSLRNQVWTHYDLGLTWAPPPGIWKTSAGDAAEAIWPGAPVVQEQLVSGAYAALFHLKDFGSLDKSHAALVESIAPLTESPRRTRIAGQKARSSWVQTTDPLPQIWQISTFRAPNGQLLGLITYALVSSLDRARPDMEAIAQTLSDTRGLAARVVTRDAFESHRLGVRMALHDDLPCQDAVPENVASQADGLICALGSRSVLMMALRESSSGVGGEEIVLQLVQGMLGEEMGRMSGKEQIRSVGALGGQESMRMSFGPQGGRVEVDMITRDRVMVLFMITGMSEAERERWRAGFAFID